MGFAPAPNPKLIATYKTGHPALAVSRGLDRDRVVDETGNQTVVFGRRGSRPFTLEEMQKFYWRSNSVYTVQDSKHSPASKPTFEYKDTTSPATVAAQPGERLMRRGH